MKKPMSCYQNYKKSMSTKKKFTAITPFICIIAFVLLKYFKIFEPGENGYDYRWLIFTLILIVPIVVGEIRFKFSYPSIVIIVFLLLGFVFQAWHPGWLVFLTIPVYYIIVGPNYKKFKSKSESDDKEFFDI